MAYNFGQLRRNQIRNYLTDLGYESVDEKTGSVTSYLVTESPISEETKFIDMAINLSNQKNFVAIGDDGKQKCYYCRFRIRKDPEMEQSITIQLYNKDAQKSKDAIQSFKTVTVPRGLAEEFVVFDIVFAPNSTYNYLKFLLNRVSKDYAMDWVGKDGKTYHGRIIDVQILQLAEVYNIVNTLTLYMNNKNSFKQIGVQSAPGLQMCIDGEEIRVGRSGIYEINHGVDVNFVGFIVQPGDGKQFIFDYQY